jgi:hydroxyacylglutathione hydrolase
MGQLQAKRARNEPTVPSTIGDEKKFNPFMRVEYVDHLLLSLNESMCCRISDTLKTRANSSDPVEVMGFLRHEKDGFK